MASNSQNIIREPLTPLVSVHIVTYNRAHFLPEAIESVLQQTYRNWELIVVDDGSTDETRQVVERYRRHDERIRYAFQPNSGIGAARNRGIELARGTFVAWLDDDDLWLPEKLSKQVKLFQKNPALGWVYAKCRVQRNGQTIAIWPSRNYEHSLHRLVLANFIPCLTVMVKRQLINDVGRFDVDLEVSHDYDLWLRLARGSPFDLVPEVLAVYRQHDSNISSDVDGMPSERSLLDHFIVFQKVPVNPELGISASLKRRRIAEDRLALAKIYYRKGLYSKAMPQYGRALMVRPLIGLKYWEPQFENWRFTAPVRFLLPYLRLANCVVRSISEVVISSASQVPITVSKVFLALAAFSVQVDRKRNGASKKVGLLNLEYFHEDFGGYGGYGMSAKNVTDYFNVPGSGLGVDMLLTRNERLPRVATVHRTHTIVAPEEDPIALTTSFRYLRMLTARNLDLLVTMEFYPSYLRTLFHLPRTPVLIWIHDPRPEDRVRRIATVPLELVATGKKDIASSVREVYRKQESMEQLLSYSRLCGRKVYFATTAYSLIDLAKRVYGLDDIPELRLPTPVAIPNLNHITYSSTPRVLFLGRLDPIKRPWIYFELAKQFPTVEFLVAGKTQTPDLMNPIIKRYEDTPNLKFLGLTVGDEKDALLKSVWAVVNTSVHEALPVSFLETFAYGKPIISCHNPDQMAERFGHFTGEVIGEGFDQETIDKFSAGMEWLLNHQQDARMKGEAARRFVAEHYSFQAFERVLHEVLNGNAPNGTEKTNGHSRSHY